jgi:hypothetical protein
MSGRPSYVCGLRVDFHTVTVTDPHICSVFYEVASHISNFEVRSALQGVLGLGNPSMLPPVEIQRDGDEYGYTYTISNAHLTFYLPISSDDIDPIPVVVDSAICLAIGLWSSSLNDQQLRASVRAAANLGFQATARYIAQGFADGS